MLWVLIRSATVRQFCNEYHMYALKIKESYSLPAFVAQLDALDQEVAGSSPAVSA